MKTKSTCGKSDLLKLLAVALTVVLVWIFSSVTIARGFEPQELLKWTIIEKHIMDPGDWVVAVVAKEHLFVLIIVQDPYGLVSYSYYDTNQKLRIFNLCSVYYQFYEDLNPDEEVIRIINSFLLKWQKQS